MIYRKIELVETSYKLLIFSIEKDSTSIFPEYLKIENCQKLKNYEFF